MKAPTAKAAGGSARPRVAPAPPWAFPVPETGDLDNGMRVLAYDVPGQHVYSVRLAIPAPLCAEPRELEGVGTIMARTLDEGTARYDAQQMAELLERQGVGLGAGVGERGLVIEVDVTRRHVVGALDLLRQVLLEPAFPEQEVRRHVRTRVAEIEQDYANPAQRAGIAFAAAFYDGANRLSRPTGGSIATVNRLTREDLATYHAQVVRPSGAVLAIAGDFAGFDPLSAVDAALRSWDAGSATDRTPDEEDPGFPSESRIVLVDRPGSVQSELYVGCPGPDRAVRGGWAPYPVLGFILGGGPQARLDAVLREDKGYTYGMRCGFRPRRGSGLFLVNGSVRADVTADALALTLDILDGGREGFTDEESERGIEYLCLTAPGRYATADAVADEAAGRALEGLTTEHTTQMLRDMRDLTPKRLRKAYRAYVDGTWTSVVVGDAASLRGPLEALGRGEVVVVES